MSYSDKSLKRIKKNVVDGEVSPAITANAMQSINHQNCILIKNATKQGYLEAVSGDVNAISARMEYHRGNVQKGMIQTLTTMGGNDVGTIQGLRIRKLTPVETCKLMGFTREDYQAMRDMGLSDSAIFHCCGDSIVTTVLMSIFSQLFHDDNRHVQLVKNYVKEKLCQE